MNLLRLALATALLAVGCAELPARAPARVEGAAGGWRLFESEHFLVRTDAGAAVVSPLLARLEDVHQALSASFFEGVPMPRIDVLLFAREADFRAVAPDGLTGFFIPDVGDRPDGWMVLSAGLDPGTGAAVAAHELAHRFLYALSDQVPTWMHEGFAKYVGSLDIAGARLQFDAGAIRTDRASPVPLARLLASSSADFFGASARAQYLTAWMLVRQLLAPAADPAAGRDVGSKWRRLVARIVTARSPQAQAVIIGEALGGVDADQLDAAVRASEDDPAAGAHTGITVALARAHRRPPRVRPLDGQSIQPVLQALRERARP
jgi:hypothetical protein